ncbi:hypothetical protein CDAR_246701 [Caerostris darwini]|uniref:Uncharacterized protein n=1 Tax=Caerostris darwini TaxID=1538125 RepID=A0AAV4TC93_9ARAC|nr:hypothetical protein CDAR_246701 [Caerostris darwini]
MCETGGCVLADIRTSLEARSADFKVVRVTRHWLPSVRKSPRFLGGFHHPFIVCFSMEQHPETRSEEERPAPFRSTLSLPSSPALLHFSAPQNNSLYLTTLTETFPPFSAVRGFHSQHFTYYIPECLLSPLPPTLLPFPFTKQRGPDKIEFLLTVIK